MISSGALPSPLKMALLGNLNETPEQNRDKLTFPTQSLGISCRNEAEVDRISPVVKQDYFTSQVS